MSERIHPVTDEQKSAIDNAMEEARKDLGKGSEVRKPLTDSEIALVRASIGLHNTFMGILAKQRDLFKK